MIRRVILLFVTNLLVMLVLATIANVAMQYFGIQTGSYTGLMFFCFILGMGGSLVSLLMSKWMAKRMMRMQELNSSHPIAQQVHSLARRSGIDNMPEVFIYEAPDVNAFATGPSKNNSMVAVSTGLLNSMNGEEVEAVLAHEVAHIANGDMVTMTMVQGIVNSFAMFLSYIVSNFIMNAMRGDDDDGRGIGDFFLYHIIHNLVYMAISFLSLPLIMWFSRWREYRADAHSAKLVGKHKMIAALEALKKAYPHLDKQDKNVEVMAISAKNSWAEMFSSHPPLDKRIAALRN